MNAPILKTDQVVSRRGVVEAFLEIEVMRSEHASFQSEFKRLQNLDDRAFFDGVRKFADARSDTNPLLVFTVGVRRDERWKTVQSWTLEQIAVGEFYSQGINTAVNLDLATVNWNFSRFVSLAHKHPEFRLNETPRSERLRRVYGVRKYEHGHEGSFAIIDGAHRLVALAANGEEFVWAYIATVR